MPIVNPSAFGPKPFFVDASGNPTVGYKMFMYAAGSTSTKQNSYTNSTGSVANINPIILNALGQTPNELWWDASLLYKVVLAPSTDTDPPTNPVWTVDNLQGMNSGAGATSANEWVLYSASAIAFVNASSFTLVGNQTLTFHIGRRLQLMTSAGFVYGRITNSVFAASTTVTVQMDGSQVLDSGLSAVYYSILTNDVLALPERISSTTGTNTYAATVGIARLVIGDEYKINVAIPNDGSASPTLSLDGNTALSIFTQNGLIPVPGALNGAHKFRYTGSAFVVLNPNISLNQSTVRQSINSAPVDANGFTALGGATGAATVTTTAIGTSTPIIVNAAAGVSSIGILGDRIGFSSTNLSWSGLNINGSMQLSVDVGVNGTLTPVSGALFTNYQQGGTFSITNGQQTFNYGVMNQTVGNGTTAVQSYRVAVGEVTVAGGVVTAIIWYALNRKFYQRISGIQAVSTRILQSHKLGIQFVKITANIINTTAENSYVSGNKVPFITYGFNGSFGFQLSPIQILDRNTSALATLNNLSALTAAPASTPGGTITGATVTNWDTEIIVEGIF